MKKVTLVTDGGCSPNPGRGGWAAILRFGKHSKEVWGYEAQTTNNRMELTAAVKALQELIEPCEVEIVTDSQYVKNGITKWIKGWKKNGWLTSEKNPVLNRDLWEALDAEVNRHKMTWTWTKGHASHKDNNRADELAGIALTQQVSGSRARQG